MLSPDAPSEFTCTASPHGIPQDGTQCSGPAAFRRSASPGSLNAEQVLSLALPFLEGQWFLALLGHEPP